MANVDNPAGFTPAYHQTGGTIRAKEYRVATDGSITAIHTGDIVSLTTDGTIIAGVASTPAIGVFAGVRYTSTSGEAVWSKFVGTNLDTQGDIAYALVYDDPQIVFRAQFSGASGVAQIGSTFDLLATAGSNTTGLSNHEIDSSDATDVLLRLLDFVDDPTNDSTLDNAEAYVMIAEHQLVPSATSGDLS